MLSRHERLAPAAPSPSADSSQVLAQACCTSWSTCMMVPSPVACRCTRAGRLATLGMAMAPLPAQRWVDRVAR